MCGYETELYGLTFNERVDFILVEGLNDLDDLLRRTKFGLTHYAVKSVFDRTLEYLANQITDNLIRDYDLALGAQWSELSINNDRLKIRLPNDWMTRATS